MRYSLEPTYRRYVKGYGFLSFAKKFGEKYAKNLTDTAKKQGTNFAKTAGKKNTSKKCRSYWRFDWK